MLDEILEERNFSAPSLAGIAILLEIGAEYRVLDMLRTQDHVEVIRAAKETNISEHVLEQYFEALKNAGLLEDTDVTSGLGKYKASRYLAKAVHDVGYLSWGLRACQPLIAHAREFAAENSKAQSDHPRDGGLIARTSQWMGEKSFYPHAEEAILSLKPKKIVDLGCGSGRLLVKCLKQLPGTTGVGVDLSLVACETARAVAKDERLVDRLDFIHSSIQALAEDPTPLIGAEVIHAGFVLHDLMPDEESILNKLLAVCRSAAPNATLIVVDAVPFAKSEDERAFSAAFSYLHHGFMGRRLQTEHAWSEKLTNAGFKSIEVQKLGIPGGRLFAAR